MCENMAQRHLSLLMDNDPELQKEIESRKIKVRAKPWVSLRPMVEMAEKIAESALSKCWQFFVPPDGFSLVTSDNPVVFSGGPSGNLQIGPANPFAELLINLRKDIALVCTPQCYHPDMQTFQMNLPEARKFNRAVVRAARYRVFADQHSETIDKFVKKYQGEEQRFMI